jgi:NADPH2:quinone reductase
MKAIEVPSYGDSSVLQTVDREVPEPGPGEVRIDVDAAGVNFADVMQRRGEYPDGPEPPFVAGFEAAGEIDAVGPEVERDVGETVVGFVDGGYAERAVAHAAAIFDVPDGMDVHRAAGFPAQYLTAHNCLFEWGGLESDERVYIPAAAGGVGSAAVQLADRAGAEIYAAASADEKLELAAALGANHTINYEADDVVAEVNSLTGSEDIDLALEMVGGEASNRILDMLSPTGRVVTYGIASGDPGWLSTRKIIFNNYDVRGYHLGRAMEHEPERLFEAVEPLLSMLREGEVEVQLDRRFALEEVSDAHEYLEQRRSTGKVVLEP